MGFHCATAAGGLDAMAQLRETDFDVVLTDLNMPGMDGIELLRQMQETGIRAVPIMLSGSKQVSQAIEASQRGAFDFMEKPTKMDKVRQVIARALKHRRVVRHAQAMSDLAGPAVTNE